MGLLNEAFTFIESTDWKDHNAQVRLPRSVAAATELTLVAALAPLIPSDISIGIGDRIYATDASGTRGAVCSTAVSSDIAQILFKT